MLGDEPIALRDLEAACLRLAKSRAPDAYVIPPKEQRVAVIGAGVSGLACALNLAQKRYLVTVFDQQPGWGGSLRTHPRFAEFDADIALQFGPVDAEFRFGAAVASLDEVVEFDAVYVATGAGSDAFGLAGACDRALFTTALPKVFVGGQVCGATLMEAIAEGVEASKVMEMFLATGRVARASTPYDKEGCGRYLEHRGASSAARVVAAQPEGYTEDEARAEAQRCLQCDCDDCLAACEMLKRFRKEPKKIGVEVFTDMGVNPPLSSRTVTREVYSCNVCGYCGSICPEGVDVGALMQFSREARCAAGVAPAALHDYWLREMDFATTEGAFASPARGRETCEYAFFPGCQLGADSAERVLAHLRRPGGRLRHGHLPELLRSARLLGRRRRPAGGGHRGDPADLGRPRASPPLFWPAPPAPSCSPPSCPRYPGCLCTSCWPTPGRRRDRRYASAAVPRDGRLRPLRGPRRRPDAGGRPPLGRRGRYRSRRTARAQSLLRPRRAHARRQSQPLR